MKGLLSGLLLLAAQIALADNSGHAIAMHGSSKYAENFKHFDYVDATAQKGGTLKLARQGNFDSLNPYIAKGNSADGLGLIYDSLTVASADEAFSQYALVAERIYWADDRSWVEYQLRDNARFHDGKSITAKDIKFTFELLMQKGSPFFKSQYADVKDILIKNPLRIRFNFNHGKNKELALLIGQLPILPAHATDVENFDSTTLTPALGSGPYKIGSVDAGKSISFTRIKDYWAKDLNVNLGRYNFDEIRYDYYRDSTVMLEALKVGQYDFRLENIAKLWATAYEGSAIDEHKLLKRNIAHANPAGMQAFAINLRNPLFTDARVRQALNLAFDFEWTNNNLFYAAYSRSNSYFSNSELASSGLPSDSELQLLNPLKAQLPSKVFTEAYKNSVSKGDGNQRQQLRRAKQLLNDAGWSVTNNQLINNAGVAFQFEFLIYDASFERVINPYIKSLEKLGIKASIRKVEISQYIQRMRQFEFDIMVASFPQSLSPGTEQIQYWHSSQADTPASRNIIGIKDPAIDSLVMALVEAKTRPDLVTASKALDRALLHNYFVIPQWYIGSHRIAYWDKFKQPKISPQYDYSFFENLMTWSYDSEKAQRLNSKKKI